jgi:chorismate mutase
MPGEGKEADRREDGAEKAEYDGDRLIAEQRAEQRESPVGKRDSVPAHIIKLSRLSAGGRRRNRAEEETGKSITESLNRPDPIPGQTQTAGDVPRIAHGIDGHTDKAEQQQAAVGLPKERGKVLTVQLSPDDPDGSCAQDKQQQNKNDSCKNDGKKDSGDKEYREGIEQLRSRIDYIDEDLLKEFGARMDVSRLIGAYKRDHNVAIVQTVRWDAVMEGMKEKARAYGLSEKFIDDVFNAIHEESIRIQNGVLSAGREA